jgi:hypothetical protein
LQAYLDKLNHWSRRWKLWFKKDKSKVMHIGRNDVNMQYNLKDGEEGLHQLQVKERRRIWEYG